MTVYVDDARNRLGRMWMSHMVATTTDELLGMADRIGLHRGWLQHGGTPDEHFDVSQTMRQRALDAGAVAVTPRDVVRLIRAKR